MFDLMCRCRKSTGFTLLEVLLALLISAVVLGALAAAIHLQLNVATVSRTGVEEAQLARAVLRIIADDLYETIQPAPVDVSSVASLYEGLSSSAGSSLGSFSGAADGGDTGSGGNDTGGETDSESSDSTATTSSAPILGLFGTQYDLRIDIRSTPRVDQYDMFVAQALEPSAMDRLSEVKTVYYFVYRPGMMSGPAPSNTFADPFASSYTLAEPEYGLMRAEVDRAALDWSELNGLADTLIQEGRPLASEIEEIEFRYFDGTSWYTEWDSGQLGGLPTAVEVAVALRSGTTASQSEQIFGTVREQTTTADAASIDSDYIIYRLLVFLPGSKLPDAATSDSSTSSSSSSSATDGQGASGDSSQSGGSSS